MTETPLTLSLDPGRGHLWLNLAALRRTNTLVQGSTRAGKSYLVRWLCEQVFGQVQQLIFDVEGEYVSLTEAFDYALFSADTPVKPDPEAAPLLMRRLLETGNSAIFDLSELDSPTQQRFAAAAAAELVRASPREPRSVLVVIDEAQRLAPQAGQGEAASTGAIRDLANRGLKRGIALLLATQRHSSVDAGLRGALANLVVGGTPPGPDMKSSGEKLGFTAAERRQLASLRAGEFFFLGPAFGDPDAGRSVQLARAGSLQTRHLDAGEARIFTPPPASDAVQSLYDLLGAEETAGEAKPSTPAMPPIPRVAASASRVAAPAAIPTTEKPVPVPAARLETVETVSAAPPAPASDKPVGGTSTAGSLPSGAAHQFEAVLADFSPWPLTPAQIALLGELALTPAQAANQVRVLRRKGVAGWDGERLTYTGATRAALMSLTEYRRRWRRVLGTTAMRLLDILQDEQGARGLTWTQWLAAAAYSPGGNMNEARAKLLDAGFVVKESDKYRVSEAWPADGAEGSLKGSLSSPLLKISR